jgi:hypothetical protein
MKIHEIKQENNEKLLGEVFEDKLLKIDDIV